jgi:hypothetical protein
MATIRRRSGGYNVQIRKQGYSTITDLFNESGVALVHAPEWLSQDL